MPGSTTGRPGPAHSNAGCGGTPPLRPAASLSVPTRGAAVGVARGGGGWSSVAGGGCSRLKQQGPRMKPSPLAGHHTREPCRVFVLGENTAKKQKMHPLQPLVASAGACARRTSFTRRGAGCHLPQIRLTIRRLAMGREFTTRGAAEELRPKHQAKAAAPAGMGAGDGAGSAAVPAGLP
jgi:hypothetical protein